ncbi:MAG: PilT/PilU family type 4a pilus ATPase [Phycisphaerae bacterium]|nr:PilT/PilU family type 4a pilus ATPase [Phycisphaerae bacterium]
MSNAPPTQPIASDTAPPAEDRGRLRKFWKAAIQLEVSDVLIRPDAPVRFRIRGELKNADAPPFTPDELNAEIREMLSDEQWNYFQSHGSVDLAHSYDADNRFRLNIFRTLGRPAIAARRISSEILNYEQLNLPPVFSEMTQHHQGLVLLCGVTGSGKSTTIAAMLQQINEARKCHILTIEDPIEFIFKDASAMVNQREVGVDVATFEDGIRAMVRENPDVVLIGELRDRTTFEAAVQAAETGHLVFGTVHASSASQCFGRIYNLFPAAERTLIREMFAQSFQAIVYQRLLKTLLDDVPRVPAVEVLLGTPVARKYVMDERETELGDVIKSSQDAGMIDLTSSLVDLVNKQYIHPKVAIEAARNPDELKMRMKGIETT